METKQMCFLRDGIYKKKQPQMLVGTPGVCESSIWSGFSEFLKTALVGLYLLVSQVCPVETHSDNPHFTFHFLNAKATVDFGMFNSPDMSLKDQSFL
ncbi:hypothetical protein TNCV_2073811 [Trichonephila clavipes]|nr:hypothetical protein TNCV_2073811 [Trichonephila clavipes]